MQLCLQLLINLKYHTIKTKIKLVYVSYIIKKNNVSGE
jgi:hypothetical protein